MNLHLASQKGGRKPAGPGGGKSLSEGKGFAFGEEERRRVCSIMEQTL